MSPVSKYWGDRIKVFEEREVGGWKGSKPPTTDVNTYIDERVGQGGGKRGGGTNRVIAHYC